MFTFRCLKLTEFGSLTSVHSGFYQKRSLKSKQRIKSQQHASKINMFLKSVQCAATISKNTAHDTHTAVTHTHTSTHTHTHMPHNVDSITKAVEYTFITPIMEPAYCISTNFIWIYCYYWCLQTSNEHTLQNNAAVILYTPSGWFRPSSVQEWKVFTFWFMFYFIYDIIIN